MSTFSKPWQALPGVDEWSRVSNEFATPLQKDFAATVGLLAHPTAPLVAISAFGFGLAAHAFGIWAGTMLGAAQASQRLLAPLGTPPDEKRPAAEVNATTERSKPTLKVVPKAEPVEAGTAAPAAVAEPAPAAQPAAKLEAAAEPGKPAAAKADTAALPRAKAPKPAPIARAEPTAAVAAVLPAQSPRKPRAIDRPAVPDDLKAIAGIGPKLEKVLNGLGVWTYAQIAAWSKDEIAWVDDFLSFKGRIDRDGWIAQAATLAGGSKAQD